MAAPGGGQAVLDDVVDAEHRAVGGERACRGSRCNCCNQLQDESRDRPAQREPERGHGRATGTHGRLSVVSASGRARWSRGRPAATIATSAAEKGRPVATNGDVVVKGELLLRPRDTVPTRSHAWEAREVEGRGMEHRPLQQLRHKERATRPGDAFGVIDDRATSDWFHAPC